MGSLFDRHRKQKRQKQTKNKAQSAQLESATSQLDHSAGTGNAQSDKGDVSVERLSHDGRGVARDSAGKTIFISGALPGERVHYKVHTTRSRFDEAVIAENIQPSDLRAEPFCPHYVKCGGCQLQHMRPEAQISFKQDVIAEQFRHFGNHQSLPKFSAPITSDDKGYRRKARLGVKWRKDGSLTLGFREQQSKFVTDINECAVLEPALERLIQPLHMLLPQLKGKREIGHIELIAGESVYENPEHPHIGVVVRALKPLVQEDRALWLSWAEANRTRFIVNHGSKLSCLFPSTEEGSSEHHLFHYDVEGIRMAFSPHDFIQVNAGVNRKMVRQAIDWLQLSEQDSVLDLFSGFGNFTLPLAGQAGSVTGIEAVASQVERGRYNAEQNNISGANFECADLNKPQQLMSESCNVVVLDPPRAGAEEVARSLVHSSVDRVLYVSCNPATLARDSEILNSAFRLERICMMDMFCHTAHAETMALFVRK